MELNEAFAHAKEVATRQRKEAEELREFSEHITPSNKQYDVIIGKCLECAAEHEQLAAWLEELSERREADRWISIKTRPLTEEEKQNAIEKHDIDPDDLEYPFAWHFDCELPKLKEGEQSVDVLVTTGLGFVKVTNFFIDYLGCPCFEDMDEAGELVAWMPLPKAYESEAKND